MGNDTILKSRMNRLSKLAQDIKKESIVLTMREKDGEDVSDERVRLDELAAKNANAIQNTLEALEELEKIDSEE